MKLRIKYEVGRWIMRRFRGKVLYPFVLFKQKKEDVPTWLFRHELEHVYQVRRMGYLWFHIKYVYLLIKHGYEKHPFELEANERQGNSLTFAEEKLRGPH